MVQVLGGAGAQVRAATQANTSAKVCSLLLLLLLSDMAREEMAVRATAAFRRKMMDDDENDDDVGVKMDTLARDKQNALRPEHKCRINTRMKRMKEHVRCTNNNNNKENDVRRQHPSWRWGSVEERSRKTKYVRVAPIVLGVWLQYDCCCTQTATTTMCVLCESGRGMQEVCACVAPT